MTVRMAKADVTPVRQRTQYTCMPASLCVALRSLGHDCSEDEVNEVMGARPMKGAAWEQALACIQHYGCRGTLVVPSTVRQLKAWTDRGVPVMIAWNPEGREWSHASLVFDVSDDFTVHVADPNIPDPEETVRVVSKSDFYSKWYEKWPHYLVRRPALAIEREVTPDGKQVQASSARRVAARHKRATSGVLHTVTPVVHRTEEVVRGTEARVPFHLIPNENFFKLPKTGEYGDSQEQVLHELRKLRAKDFHLHRKSGDVYLVDNWISQFVTVEADMGAEWEYDGGEVNTISESFDGLRDH